MAKTVAVWTAANWLRMGNEIAACLAKHRGKDAYVVVDWDGLCWVRWDGGESADGGGGEEGPFNYSHPCPGAPGCP